MGEFADFWGDPNPLNPEGEPCHGCGWVARGLAFLDDKRYCHGDEDVRPTCYEKAVSTLPIGRSAWLRLLQPFAASDPASGSDLKVERQLADDGGPLGVR